MNQRIVYKTKQSKTKLPFNNRINYIFLFLYIKKRLNLKIINRNFTFIFLKQRTKCVYFFEFRLAFRYA